MATESKHLHLCHPLLSQAGFLEEVATLPFFLDSGEIPSEW